VKGEERSERREKKEQERRGRGRSKGVTNRNRTESHLPSGNVLLDLRLPHNSSVLLSVELLQHSVFHCDLDTLYYRRGSARH
jgi:hypothetical protein